MVIKFVSSLYSKNPMLANSISGFLIFTFGDVISQFIPPVASAPNGDISLKVLKDAYTTTKVDTLRAISFGALGVLENGLILHYWYRTMEKYIGTSMTSRRVIFGKILADQAVYAPGSILIYFGYTAAIAPLFKSRSQGTGSSSDDKSTQSTSINSSEEHSIATSVESFLHKTRRHLWDTWLADCVVWPVTNFINFKYIPLNYRPTFMGIVLVFWQSYLSFVSNKPSYGGTKAKVDFGLKELTDS